LSVVLRTAHALVVNGRATVTLACSGGSAGSACRGTLSLSIRKRTVRLVHHRRRVGFTTIVLARAGYTVTSGASRSIKLRLTSAGLALLRHAPHGRASVRATATLTGGRAAQRTIALQLEPRKRG
jgi:hypothetical protein